MLRWSPPSRKFSSRSILQPRSRSFPPDKTSPANEVGTGHSTPIARPPNPQQKRLLCCGSTYYGLAPATFGLPQNDSHRFSTNAFQRVRSGSVLPQHLSRHPASEPISEKHDPSRNAEVAASQQSVQRTTEHVQLSQIYENVEQRITQEIPQRMGFTPGPQDASIHELLFDFMPAYVQRDRFRSENLQALWPALEGVLPPDPLNESNITAQRPMQRSRHTDSSPTALNVPCAPNTMNLGWHLPMFPYPVHSSKLLPDGTDTRFLPGPAEKWPYRLWSSGSVVINGNPSMMESLDSDSKHLIERPVALSVKEDRKDGSHIAAVTVKKSIYDIHEAPAAMHTSSNTADLFSRSENMTADKCALLPVIEEQYTLVFLQEKPAHLSSPPRYIKAPYPEPLLSRSLAINRHLLFAWSAATLNAHLIHLDPTFARESYAAPNLLVHGPLTLFLVLEWFRRSLTGYAMHRPDRFHLMHINYKIIQPIFVDEGVTFCASPKKSQLPGQLVDQWDVWIEKDLYGDALISGNIESKTRRTTVFRATVKVQVAKDKAPKTSQTVVPR